MTNDECAQALRGVLAETAAGLRAIDEAQSAIPRAPGKWSRREILGHLIDSAANNHQRFVRAQQTDRFSFPPYAQDAWVALQDYNARTWADLLVLWEAYNRHLAHVMAHCNPALLDTPCIIESPEPVSLVWLMNDYLDHLNHHLGQILE